MPNEVCAYSVYSPEIFEEIATLSGLAQTDTLIRLSPDKIDGLKDSVGCMTSGAISAFVNKYPGLSGDCYVTLTSDKHGREVLALDIVRPDVSSKICSYVMDQEPIYIIKHLLGWGATADAKKVFHLSCEGRTFPLSNYNKLSSYLEERRDTPVTYAEISDFDPGIVNAISQGIKRI